MIPSASSGGSTPHYPHWTWRPWAFHSNPRCPHGLPGSRIQHVGLQQWNHQIFTILAGVFRLLQCHTADPYWRLAHSSYRAHFKHPVGYSQNMDAWTLYEYTHIRIYIYMNNICIYIYIHRYAYHIDWHVPYWNYHIILTCSLMRQDLLGSFLWDQVFIWRSPRGTPKSSILIIGYSWIFHYKPSSYWGIPMDTSHTWSTQGGLVVTSIFMVSFIVANGSGPFLQ